MFKIQDKSYRCTKVDLILQFVSKDYLTNKFLNFWKPSAAFFIDSEIWPNMIVNLEKSKIPILIINGRLTKKSFERWKLFPNFSYFIFSKIKIDIGSNNLFLININL